MHLIKILCHVDIKFIKFDLSPLLFIGYISLSNMSLTNCCHYVKDSLHC